MVLNKHSNHTVEITGLTHEGRGIAHIDKKPVFIDQGLPGELAEIEITQKNSKYCLAKITTLLKASPQRISPKCQHFSLCGGCQLQHLSNEDQLALKKNNLLEQLKHIGKIDINTVEHLPSLTASPWGYRYKARLSVKYVEKKQKLLIGFHEKNGRFIADLTQCEVLHPKIGLNLELLREFILSLSIFKHIPQIEISCDQQHAALIIRHLSDFSENDKNILKNFAKQHDYYIYLQANRPDNLEKIYPENTDEYDLLYSNNDITYQFYPTDFTQINPAINSQMIQQAITLLALSPEDTALDLFCGLGNFSLALAKYCQHVIGIEGDAQMVKRARHNATLNGLNNTEFFTANLFEPDSQSPWLNKPISKILLDPPRSGAFEMLPYIHKLSPKRLVYVSCNPATLARDAGELVNRYGFRVIKLGLMDMFPHTKHIESIMLLTR